MLTGGCFCGGVRYEADGEPYNSTLCHCVDCRRATGAPYVGWFSVRAADYRIVTGAPMTWESSPNVTRGFCPHCGTQLTFQRAELAHEIDVTTCSLDHPELVPPRDHIRAAGRVPWVSLNGDLPVYPGPRGWDPGG
jgi:hypothetical protein